METRRKEATGAVICNGEGYEHGSSNGTKRHKERVA
jgi:hypothetical protein